MRNMRTKAVILVLSVWLLAGTGLAASGDPGGAIRPFLPNQFDENWHGLWEFNIVVVDCDTQDPLWSDFYEQAFCEGEDYDLDTDPNWQDIDCQGGIVGNELDSVCTMTEDVLVNCTAYMTLIMHMELDGDTITGFQTVETEYSGSGCFIPYSCMEFTYTATRIDTDPTECDPQPNEAASWSDVKGIYR